MLRAKLISDKTDYIKGGTKILSWEALMGAKTSKNVKKWEKKISTLRVPTLVLISFARNIYKYCFTLTG